MLILAWIAGIVAALFALHLLALWMERRGWIYYVKKQPSASAVGTAVLEIQSLLQPEKKHVIQMRRERRVQKDDTGEPKPPDASEPSGRTQ
jgi:hypothetical protein